MVRYGTFLFAEAAGGMKWKCVYVFGSRVRLACGLEQQQNRPVMRIRRSDDNTCGRVIRKRISCGDARARLLFQSSRNGRHICTLGRAASRLKRIDEFLLHVDVSPPSQPASKYVRTTRDEMRTELDSNNFARMIECDNFAGISACKK